MPFALGGSNVTSTSGADASGTAVRFRPMPSVAATTTPPITLSTAVMPDGSNCGNGPNVTPGDPSVLVNGNTPSFLQSVQNARLFMYGPEGMMNSAINQGRYFTSGAEAINSAAGPRRQ